MTIPTLCLPLSDLLTITDTKCLLKLEDLMTVRNQFKSFKRVPFNMNKTQPDIIDYILVWSRLFR